MPKRRTTVTIDDEVFRAVRIKAARTGKRDSQAIEEALRRDLGLDALRGIWAGVDTASAEDAAALADAELHAMREEKRAAGSP
jgi:hypothetical protein